MTREEIVSLEEEEKKKTKKARRTKKGSEKKVTKKVKKEMKDLAKYDDKNQASNYRTKCIQIICLVVVCILLLVLLLNRTFFKEEYKNGNIVFDLPLLMYYVGDEDGTVTFKTLRKSQYVKEWADEYLSTLDRYECSGNAFYYNKDNGTIIKSITVEKTFAIKTVKVNYIDKKLTDLCVGDPSLNEETFDPSYINPDDVIIEDTFDE